MRFKLFSVIAAFFYISNSYAVTECTEKIESYFVGSSQLNEAVAHLWVNFQGGGSASLSTEGAAFEAMLSTVIASVAADKVVKVRYLDNNVSCKAHHTDWVGLWLYK